MEHILTHYSASIKELKRVIQADYCVNKLEDMELAGLVKSRLAEKAQAVEVSLDDL